MRFYFSSKSKENKAKKLKNLFLGFFLVFFVVAILFIYGISTPNSTRSKFVTIPEGYSINQVASLLKEKGLIRSDFLARFYMKYIKLSPKFGSYVFSGSDNLFTLIKRITSADYGDVYKSITFPEGVTNQQLVSIIKSSSFLVDENNLLSLIHNKEGYLFPDTYFFLPDVDEKDIIATLEETFLKKIKVIEKDKTIQKSRNDIVIMASILEKEASNDLYQKQIISGILWKRIKIGMPLQVDAPFLYERGKGSSKLSNNDLQEDSPYNTYINKGLTPTPIGNPGYDSLYAASHPINSEYLFYLHGSDGKIHYGKDYNEHLRNKRLYLR